MKNILARQEKRLGNTATDSSNFLTIFLPDAHCFMLFSFQVPCMGFEVVSMNLWQPLFLKVGQLFQGSFLFFSTFLIH